MAPIGRRAHCAASLVFLLPGLWLAPVRAGEPEAPPPKAEGESEKSWRVPLIVNAFDPEGKTLTFKWTQIAGPTVKIADPAAAKTYFIPTEPGTYEFEIRVSDGMNESVATFRKVVTKPNLPPLAVPAANPAKAILKQRVLLDAGQSSDPDGKISAYQWTQRSGPKLKLSEDQLKDRQFFFEAEEPGSYVFELKVFDGKSWSAPVAATVQVAAVDKKPVIVPVEEEAGKNYEIPVEEPTVHQPAPKAGALPQAIAAKGRPAQVGEKLVLDGSQSSDPLGEPLEFFWRQEDSGAPILRTLSHDPDSAKGEKKTPFDCPVWFAFPDKPGQYRFVLEVTAGKGANKRHAASEPVTFEVSDKNRPPVAQIFVKQPHVEKGQQVLLDGSGSKDPDNDRLQYLWTWSGQGLRPEPIAFQGSSASFTAKEEGSYGIQLVVNDGKLASPPAQTQVTVGPVNQPPTLTVPETVTATVGQPVRIEALVEDPENDRTEIAWTVIDPPDLKLPEEILKKNPLVFTPSEKRIYVFSARAKDSHASSPEARVQVGVTADENQAPVAILEGPRQAAPGEEVTLSAAASKDPEGKRLTYLWRQLNGPKIPGTVPGKTDSVWTFKPEKDGEYDIGLEVSDGAQGSKPHVFRLNVVKGNKPPQAKIAPPPVVSAGDETWLDGTGSADPEGQKLRFSWKLLDNNDTVELKNPDQPKLQILTRSAGKLTFELIVNDGELDSPPATTVLEILRRNREPVAVISGPERAESGQRVELSAEKSNDPDGEPLQAYQWAQVKGGSPDLGLSGNTLTRDRLRLIPEHPGSYVFELVVTDKQGVKSNPATWTVIVVGKPPEAVLTLKEKASYHVSEPVVLLANSSKDPAGRPLTYHWRQLKGEKLEIPQEAGDTLNVVPKAPGEYEIELVVRNGERDSRPATVLFKVIPGNQPPLAAIAKVSPCEPGGKITLDGSESKDPEGKELQYRWESLSSPDGKPLNLGWLGKKKKAIEVKLPLDGEYVFQLKVFDGELWSEAASVTVKTRPPNQPPSAVAVPLLLLPAPTGEGGKETVYHTARTGVLVTEERREVILDGSDSKDPDQGPAPLKYEWKLIAGTKPENITQEGARIKFVPTQVGAMVWELVVNDGKDNSQPARLKITILKPGALPVAIPAQPLIRGQTAGRDQAADSGILILDGSKSTCAEGKQLSYGWRQVGGEDLGLRPENLAKRRVGLKIYHAGKYRFLLMVFDGEYYSLPAPVDIIVTDGAAPSAPAEPKEEQGGTAKPRPKTGGAEEQDNKEQREQKAQKEPREPQDGAVLPPPGDKKDQSRARPAPASSNLAGTAPPPAPGSATTSAKPARPPHPETEASPGPRGAPDLAQALPPAAPAPAAPRAGPPQLKQPATAANTNPTPAQPTARESAPLEVPPEEAPSEKAQPLAPPRNVARTQGPTEPALTATTPSEGDQASVAPSDSSLPKPKDIKEPEPISVQPTPTADAQPSAPPPAQEKRTGPPQTSAAAEPQTLPAPRTEAAPAPQTLPAPRTEAAPTRIAAPAGQVPPAPQGTLREPTPLPKVDLEESRRKLLTPEHRANDPIFQRRREKIEQFIQAGGTEAEEFLLRTLNSRDADLAALGAIGLVRRGMGSAPALIRLLETGSQPKQVQQEVLWALRSLAKQDLGADPKAWRQWWARQVAE